MTPTAIPRDESVAEACGRHHLFSLDLIRALAIVMVVADHALKSMASAGDALLVDVFMAPDAVLFIMLSGALLLPVEGSWSRFLAKRFKRVFVPYIAWLVIHLALLYFVAHEPAKWLLTMLRWSWLTPYFGAGWFVFVIMGIYLFMPVLSPWIAKAGRRQLEYFVGIWLLGGLVIWLHWYMGMSADYNMAVMFVNYGGYAVAGYYFMRYPLGYRASAEPGGVVESVYLRYRDALIIAVGIGVGLLLPLAVWAMPLNSPEPREFLGNNLSITVYAYACLLFATLVTVKSAPRWVESVVKVLSRNAYGIYLIHLILMRLVLDRVFPALETSLWRLPVMLIAPLIVSELCRRIPRVGKYLV